MNCTRRRKNLSPVTKKIGFIDEKELEVPFPNLQQYTHHNDKKVDILKENYLSTIDKLIEEKRLKKEDEKLKNKEENKNMTDSLVLLDNLERQEKYNIKQRQENLLRETMLQKQERDNYMLKNYQLDRQYSIQRANEAELSLQQEIALAKDKLKEEREKTRQDLVNKKAREQIDLEKEKIKDSKFIEGEQEFLKQFEIGRERVNEKVLKQEYKNSLLYKKIEEAHSCDIKKRQFADSMASKQHSVDSNALRNKNFFGIIENDNLSNSKINNLTLLPNFKNDYAYNRYKGKGYMFNPVSNSLY